MWAICSKDIKQYFVGPTGYVLISIYWVISGIYFLINNLFTQNANFTGLISGLTSLFMIIVPMITMKVFSDEKKNQTDQLLLTSPLNVVSLVLGKVLAASIILFITTSIFIVFYVVLSIHGTPIFSESLIALLGFYVYGISCIALGVFISSLLESYFGAAILTFFAIFLGWIFDGIYPFLPKSHMATMMFLLGIGIALCLLLYHSLKSFRISIIMMVVWICILVVLFLLKPIWLNNFIPNAIEQILPSRRYRPFSLGILRISDLVYFISSITFFIFLTIRSIDRMRWS